MVLFRTLVLPKGSTVIGYEKIEYDMSHTYLRAREYGGRYTAKEDF